MGYALYAAQYGEFKRELGNGRTHTSAIQAFNVDYDNATHNQYWLSFNRQTGAKLFPLLGIELDEDYADIPAANLIQQCDRVLAANSAHIEEFTPAQDQMIGELLGGNEGAQVIEIGTTANTVEGLVERVERVKALAIAAQHLYGHFAAIQIC
ncbi:hypothetical protein D0962_22800 [Leptolyngbyaceae cyanobacterium CCMR0082]|uniref:Uncharacterized protein n=1 Tax=Adonisia turfae CCMR0082 TaxID=2304604 RepID=A0A6M0SAR3_9CYAN|nr:hypothetical protein [Adonisia turfae]NEZ65550.1 hypothetical protein [Adonisia turfae CCMR0082]